MPGSAVNAAPQTLRHFSAAAKLRRFALIAASTRFYSIGATIVVERQLLLVSLVFIPDDDLSLLRYWHHTRCQGKRGGPPHNQHHHSVVAVRLSIMNMLSDKRIEAHIDVRCGKHRAASVECFQCGFKQCNNSLSRVRIGKCDSPEC